MWGMQLSHGKILVLMALLWQPSTSIAQWSGAESQRFLSLCVEEQSAGYCLCVQEQMQPEYTYDQFVQGSIPQDFLVHVGELCEAQHPQERSVFIEAEGVLSGDEMQQILEALFEEESFRGRLNLQNHPERLPLLIPKSRVLEGYSDRIVAQIEGNTVLFLELAAVESWEGNGSRLDLTHLAGDCHELPEQLPCGDLQLTFESPSLSLYGTASLTLSADGDWNLLGLHLER